MITEETSASAYHGAVVDTLVLYDKSPAKSDEILSAQFILSYKNRPFRRVCQFIFLTVLRNKILIDTVISELCAKAPKAKTAAILRAAAAEILTSPAEKHPKIIHSWVNYAKSELSKSESGFINAVLRRFAPALEKRRANPDTGAKDLSILYSHPLWLVERWLREFGTDKTLEILKNNIIPSEVFLRKSPDANADILLSECGKYLRKSIYPDFFILRPGHWQNISGLLDTRYFYIQDPSTIIAPKLLDPEPGKNYLDLCSAPGGKSRAIADIVLGKALLNKQYADFLQSTLLVSIDFGQKRMAALRSNMDKIDFLKSVCLECDLLGKDLPNILAQEKLPKLYDGILLDAPCSNTGVLRRRPDAKYRLVPRDLEKCANMQATILNNAADLLKPGGKLVYSTCSIEPCENADIAENFLKSHAEFSLEKSTVIFPSEESDGASALILKKKFL